MESKDFIELQHELNVFCVLDRVAYDQKVDHGCDDKGANEEYAGDDHFLLFSLKIDLQLSILKKESLHGS